ncbi:ABC transporter substrate-binding protein [Streptantibioticus silvisoli]|uniref:ABC transporter substrate-binding protein n=1 Tax=Streptantibioticus silvisoli TaxID=2705255 RepID=A0ABT6VY66_9ACTN|nr:ABC transporter substrate-binding protein [Streptantibioticus silvisoli]MDI5962403.1 ABC transporter substrate-binding protein [Streptantibioticus silvisoli]
MHRRHLAGGLICYPAKDRLDLSAPRCGPTEDEAVVTGERRQQYERAFHLLDELTNPDNWGATDLPRSRKPSFPRSNLIKAIEEASKASTQRAVEEAAQEPVQEPLRNNTPKADRARIAWLRQHRWRSQLQWENSRLGIELKPLLDIGGIFSTLVLLALTGYLGGRLHLLLVVLSAVFLVVVLYRLAPYLRPQLLWLSRINRWFSRNTFLATEQITTQMWSWWNPRASGRVMTKRAQELANEFARVSPESTGTGDGGQPSGTIQPDAAGSAGADAAPAVRSEPAGRGQSACEEGEKDNESRLYLLQFRTLALLEDLRALYLPRRIDLRRLKRPTPPILFLPRATVADGHAALLGAINDVRSRRSEVDPLLVFAGMAPDDLEGLNTAHPWDPDRMPSDHFDEERFRTWISGLRLGQSPKGRPWVLKRAMENNLFTSPATEKLRNPREPKRRLWLRLWSLPTLIALLAAALGLFVWGGVSYQDHHCGSDRWLWFGSHDLHRVKDVTGNGRECIGVTSAAYPFDTTGFRLDGTTADNPGTGMGHDVTLSTLEQWITASNGSIGNSPHITVVYAGPLSIWQGQQASQMRNGLEELAGVYLAQNYANTGASDGPKVKVLLGNGGQELRRQYLMAQQVVAMAKKDPTIVAVVGLGRDTDDSDATVKLLQRQGLAVVDTTNSSPKLSSNLNYFGLASTDTEEANALVHQLLKDSGKNSLKKAYVVARAPAGTDDRYSQQQKSTATAALKAAGYQVVPLPYPAGADISFAGTTDQICDGTASVVYLAGRSEDVSALLSDITGDSKCKNRKFSLLSGDDLTKLDFVLDNVFVPKGVTVYFAALADPLLTGGRSVLVNSVQLVPQLSRESGMPPGSADSAAPNPSPSRTSTASTSTTPAEAQSILDQQMFDDGTLAMAFEAIEAVQDAADVSDAVHSGYRPSVLAGLDRIHLSNQPGGLVEFSHSTTPGGTDHGIVVNKVTEQSGQPKAVCATPAGTSAEAMRTAAEAAKNAGNAGKKSSGEDTLPLCTMLSF